MLQCDHLTKNTSSIQWAATEETGNAVLAYANILVCSGIDTLELYCKK